MPEKKAMQWPLTEILDLYCSGVPEAELLEMLAAISPRQWMPIYSFSDFAGDFRGYFDGEQRVPDYERIKAKTLDLLCRAPNFMEWDLYCTLLFQGAFHGFFLDLKNASLFNGLVRSAGIKPAGQSELGAAPFVYGVAGSAPGVSVSTAQNIGANFLSKKNLTICLLCLLALALCLGFFFALVCNNKARREQSNKYY